MKRFLGFALLVVLVSAPAFASKNSQTVTFPGDVKVGATQVPAGEYKVTWTGAAANAQVTLAQNGKTIATATAKIVDEKHSYRAVLTKTQGSVEVLDAIQMDNISLVFGAAPTSGQ
jgi:hypothetical protein